MKVQANRRDGAEPMSLRELWDKWKPTNTRALEMTDWSTSDKIEVCIDISNATNSNNCGKTKSGNLS